MQQIIYADLLHFYIEIENVSVEVGQTLSGSDASPEATSAFAEDTPRVGNTKSFDKYFSPNCCNIFQNRGTKSVPKMALMVMPHTIAAPISRRLHEPAPVANIMGITPKINASAVIIIGRNRITPAS